MVPGVLARSHERRHLGYADDLCRNAECTGLLNMHEHAGCLIRAELLHNVHRQLRTLHHLQLVHRIVCPGMHQLRAVLDVQ